CVMESCLSGEQLGLSLKEQTVLLLFLDHCFNSLVNIVLDLIREQVQKLVSLPMWMYLLQQELKKAPKLQKFWNLIKKNYEKIVKKECTFLASFIKKFLVVLMSIPAAGSISMEKVHCCERFIEFMIDLEALLPTRCWFNTVLDDAHLVVNCQLSHLSDTEKEGHFFCQLLDLLKFYTGFEISDQTGSALTQKEMTTLHYNRITAAFAHFPELSDFALYSVAAVDTQESLTKHFGHLRYVTYLCLLPVLPDGEDTSYHKEFFLELLTNLPEQLNQMPLYPTEKIIWDQNIVPTEYYSGEGGHHHIILILLLHHYILKGRLIFRSSFVLKGLRKHDVCFLITVRPNLLYSTPFDRRQLFVHQTGVVYVRGCEVQGMLDDKGRVIEEGPDLKPKLKCDTRTFRVWLNPNQYQQDMTNSIQNGAEDPYETFNIIMRRKCKENNFKVRQHIRMISEGSCATEDWNNDAENSALFIEIAFLFSTRIRFPVKNAKGKKHKANEVEKQDEEDLTLVVEPHVIPNRGPYPYNQPKRINTIQFTPTQIEAIGAGMASIWVVGPPGTGKRDMAQRTLIVTHPNQVHTQHLSPSASGPCKEELETEKDFSRCVNYVLSLCLELLRDVAHLQESLDVPGDAFYTCETIGHFDLYQVMSRWEEYMSKVKPKPGREVKTEDVASHFPFHKYFSNTPQPVFKGQSYQEDMDIAEGCYHHIHKIFIQLEEFRAFELLRSGLDRSKYLLVKEAKIIYDDILMEEAAQILEIETFIPFLLQNPADGCSRLKRWIMIGDHHQLPPVIKNKAFQKYSNMEQSLFTRFVRLGVPTVDLDAQGRALASLCNLYNWRYKQLGNLPHDFNGVGESEPNPYFYLVSAEYAAALYMYMCLLGYPAERISVLTTYNVQKHLIRDVINQRCANNSFFGQPSKVTTVDRFQGQQNDYIILSLVHTKA
uniref:Aquarius intron-binding spliceosomal factor n=1 Tax=Cyprinus carpio TaxID=7962 RepID=A0A8C2HN02_CYPCA